MLLEVNEPELDRLPWVLSLGRWMTFSPSPRQHFIMNIWKHSKETKEGREGGMEGGTEGQGEEGRKELNQGNPYTYCLVSIIVNIFYIYFLYKHTRTHSHMPPAYFQRFQNKLQTPDPFPSKYFGVHLQNWRTFSYIATMPLSLLIKWSPWYYQMTSVYSDSAIGPKVSSVKVLLRFLLRSMQGNWLYVS